MLVPPGSGVAKMPRVELMRIWCGARRGRAEGLRGSEARGGVEVLLQGAGMADLVSDGRESARGARLIHAWLRAAAMVVGGLGQRTSFPCGHGARQGAAVRCVRWLCSRWPFHGSGSWLLCLVVDGLREVRLATAAAPSSTG